MLALALVTAIPTAGQAGMPSTDPILSVETGVHSRIVRALAYDASRDQLISASLDRTVRTWSLPELRAGTVLRVPMELQREGELTNVQISPDGKTIAAGGWTGWEWDRQGVVYLFDASTGELRQRLTGFASIIGELRFSPDGRWLAVGLHGNAGLAFVDMQDRSVRTQDTSYSDRVVETAFASNGLIAATSLDGYLRIYSPELDLVVRQQLPGSRRLASIAFSPDGTRLAVGFFDSAQVLILGLPNLDVMSRLTVPDAPQLISLPSVAWSRDGRFVFAAGDRTDADPQSIYRFDADGDVLHFPLARGRIARLLALPGARLAYATEDPSIGVIDVNGKRLASVDSDVLDFRRGHTNVSVSSDGMTVELEPPQLPDEQLRLSIAALELVTAPHQTARETPAPDRPLLRVEDWQDGEHPYLDGIALALDRYERARSLAIAPSGSRLFLGSEWWLRAFSAHGSLLARVPTPGPVWRVAVTARGDFVVAALGDGTLRWYRSDDLREVLALFVHANGRDWVLWRPDGYYASSEHGDNYVGWHLNRGKDVAPDYFRAVQFERLFYRPDLLRRTLTERASGIESRTTVDRATLRRIAPPRVRIRAITPARPGVLRIAYEAERVGAAMKAATVYLNGVPLTTHAARKLSASEQSRFSRIVEIAPRQADNVLRIEVDTGVSIGLNEMRLPGPATQSAESLGDLHVVAIGVGRLGAARGRFPDLPFAARDAEELTAFLRTQTGGAYRNVYVTLLAHGGHPTRGNIERALRQFRAAGPADTSLLFVSAHGISDARGNYYMLPQDARPQDVRAVIDGRDVSGAAPTLIGWRKLFDSLSDAAGKRLLVVDTCHARDAAGAFDARSLKKRSASSHFPLLLSSDSGELSQDYPKARHGLFTYALLRGLRGDADADGDGFVSLDEITLYVPELVATLRDRRLGAQTPQFVVPEPMRGIQLARVPGGPLHVFEIAGIPDRSEELEK